MKNKLIRFIRKIMKVNSPSKELIDIVKSNWTMDDYKKINRSLLEAQI